MKLKPALTLIELVVVIGLIAVLIVPFIISFSGFRQRQALKSSGENFANMLRTARIYAREERHESSWGIRYVDAENYSMISGSVSSFAVVRTYELDRGVFFSKSFPDIWFEQSNGETDKGYKIKLETSSGTKADVEISKAGIVKYVSM